MKESVSAAELELEARPGVLRAACQQVAERVRDRFPAVEGFTIETKEWHARWVADPNKGPTDEERDAAYRLTMHVRRGLTWGLDVDVASSDRHVSAVEVAVTGESRLTLVIMIVSLVVGLGGAAAALLAYRSTRGSLWPERMELAAAIVGGFLASFALFGIAWLLARPLVKTLGAPLEQAELEAAFQDAVSTVRDTVSAS